MNKKVFIFSIMLAALGVLVLFAVVETNEGTPGRNLDGDVSHCGINEEGCHEGDKDPGLGVYTTPDGDDSHLFAAPLEQDGDKLKEGDYEKQFKAVARGGKDEYISILENSTDNAALLDLNGADPEVENGDKFWMGFGYIDDSGSRHVYVKEEAYTYKKTNKVPHPLAKISVESNFPDDDEKTIEIETGADEKTLEATLPKDSSLTIYFDASASYDEDNEDTLEYYWDIDGDGEYEDGNGTGEDLDETGMTYEFDYVNTGTYNLKFRVADGYSESGSIFFTLEVKETEKKPELFLNDLTIENEDGEDAGESVITKGDELTIDVYVRNEDDSGYGAATDSNVMVNLYYALKSDSYEWQLFDDMPIDFGRINDKGQKRETFYWETDDSAFSPDEYKIKAVIDEDNDISEWDEDNNEGTYDGIIDLEEFIEPAAPDLKLKDLTITPILFEDDTRTDLDEIRVNDDVEIDVTIENIGEGDADTVFVELYLDGNKEKASSSFSVAVGNTTKLSWTSKGAFSWSPADADTYDIKLELTYYHEGVAYTEEIEEEDVVVKAIGGGDPIDPNDDTQTLDDEEGWFLPAPSVSLVVVGMGGSLILYNRKRL